MKTPNKKLTAHKKCQFLVKKFCVLPINWASQIKIAQTLLKKHPDFELWKNLDPIQLKNLAFFLTEDGKSFLFIQRKKSELKLKRPNKTVLEKEKIGEDYVLKPKPKDKKKKYFLTFKTYK